MTRGEGCLGQVVRPPTPPEDDSMTLRLPIAMLVLIGCLLSGCTTDKGKKPRPQAVEETGAVSGAGREPLPKNSMLADAAVSAWEGRGFTAGWMGKTPDGSAWFETDPPRSRERGVVPAFRASEGPEQVWGFEGLPP